MPTDSLGGAEQFLKMIASYHADNDDGVTVFFMNDKKHRGWEDLEKKARILYGKGQREREGTVRLVKNLSSHRFTQYDRAYTSHSHITAIVGLLRKLNILSIRHFVARESTLVFSRFSGLRLLTFRFFYQMGFSSVDTLICQTDLMRQQLLKNIPRILKKIPNVIVLPNPINLKVAAKYADEMSFQTTVNTDYIVSAGRLIDEKGFDLLIRSFAIISSSYKNLKLVILGDGSLRTVLQTLATQLGIADKVILPGRVDNVYPYFRQAKACVVSSRIEGFPNVLLQMMSQNGNVVSTLCAGGVEDIPALITCLPDDEKELEAAVMRSLNKSKTEVEENLRTFQQYLYERTVEKFIGKIEKIMSN